MIVLAGIAGGMLLGFGVVFLTVQPAGASGVETLAPPVLSGNAGKATAALPPGRNLSLKEALRKVAFAGKA